MTVTDNKIEVEASFDRDVIFTWGPNDIVRRAEDYGFVTDWIGEEEVIRLLALGLPVEDLEAAEEQSRELWRRYPQEAKRSVLAFNDGFREWCMQ